MTDKELNQLRSLRVGESMDWDGGNIICKQFDEVDDEGNMISPCNVCGFRETQMCKMVMCMAEFRKDRTNVIFEFHKNPKPASSIDWDKVLIDASLAAMNVYSSNWEYETDEIRAKNAVSQGKALVEELKNAISGHN